MLASPVRQPWRRRVSYATIATALATPLLAILTGTPASAVSPDIVISQVYGGGGNSGATYTNDYVELFNRGTEPVDVSTWSVQYASAAGTTWQLTNLTGAIPPGGYYLVQEAQGAGGTTPLPTPDATGTIFMSASSGKVALVTNQTALTCTSCHVAAGVRDFVGYGSANDFEGTAPAPTLSNTTAALRNGDGATDTDDNGADFVAGAPNPRNSAFEPPPPPPSGCDAPATHEIAAVQGSGSSTPLAGQTVRVEGIVTGDFQGTSRLNGFFLQDSTPDDDPATSDGLFAFGASTDVAVGDRVLVTGRAAEFNGLTELSPVDAVDVCGTGTIAPAEVDLPRAPGTTFEPLEDVLTTYPEALTVTEHFQLGRFGEVTVSSDGRVFQPTEQAEPGPDAVALADLSARRRLLIDDGSTVQNPSTVPYLTPEAVRIGDSASGITGVLSFGFGSYRLEPTQAISFARTNPRPAAPGAVGGDIKVASFNTLNYFTTLRSENPDARGANNAEEFTRQQAKEVAAITGLDSDVVALMEVENNGTTAIASLVDALNAATAPGTYAYVTEPVLNAPNEFGGTFGTDAIKVALIYRPAAVHPVGAAETSADAVFSRPPLIQTFELAGGSEPFTIAVNHFKSKSCGGASGADLDQGDGQACYNATRVNQATTLANLLTGVPAALIVGDLNSYSNEDPVDVLENAGYTGLTERYVPDAERYSFVFDGFSGELDHALASPGLLDNVTGAALWHVNADEPNILDYNTEFNPPQLYEPDAYRSSDHDPVVIGLTLATAPQAPQDVSVLSGWHAATVSWQPPVDDGGSPITGYELRVLRDGTEVATATTGPATRSYTFGGLETGVTYVFEVRARNAVGAETGNSATGTPFRPSRYTPLDVRAVCGGVAGKALFDVVNANPYPIGFDWRVLRGQSGTGVVDAASTARIEVPRATTGGTKLRVSVDGVRHDEANAC